MTPANLTITPTRHCESVLIDLADYGLHPTQIGQPEGGVLRVYFEANRDVDAIRGIIEIGARSGRILRARLHPHGHTTSGTLVEGARNVARAIDDLCATLLTDYR